MKTPLLIAAFLFSLFAKAEVFVVSEDAGFDSANSTNFLQFALDEATDTLLIDNVGEPWITGPLFVNNSNITIVLESGTVMNALEAAYGIFDPMFRIRDVENVTVLGYGALIQMNKQEYIDLADSEFRHAFNLGSVVNFRMEGLEIKDTGGDGLLIGKSFQPGSTQNHSENLVIRNCIFDNNYRQGISIVSVKDCIIENCIMKNTIGTLPEAGIDIEPDDPAERIENLVIRDCQFINNNGNGIMLALFLLEDSSLDVSVTVEDCYFEDNFTLSNIYAYAEIACLDNKGNGVDGFVNFERCYVSSSQFSPVYISKSVESYALNFDNCVFKNVSQNPIDFNNPIFFEVTNYDESAPRTGGVDFTDCRIDYAADVPFLTYFENLGTVDGLGNITGNFFIVNENAPGFESGTNPENVTITFEDITGAVSEGVEVEFAETEYLENGGLPMSYTLSRAEGDAFPLAVDIGFSGEAEYGTDYAIHPPFSIISTAESTSDVAVNIIDDELIEGGEAVILSIETSSCYTTEGAGQAQTIIIDDNSLSISQKEVLSNFLIYPNPAEGWIYLKSDFSIQRIEVYGLDGRLVDEILYPGRMIDFGGYRSGNYLLRAVGQDQEETVKLVVD